MVPITLFHAFSIGGRYVQALFMLNPGNVTGQVQTNNNLPYNSLRAAGMSHDFIGLKVGILGAPAGQMKEYSTKSPGFSLFGYFRIWYSGTHDPEKLLNLGSNRTSFEIGAPMAIPLTKRKGRVTWLEVFPSVHLYTVNQDPARGNSASQVAQKALLLVENRLTHNLNPKFWAGIDLRYQFSD